MRTVKNFLILSLNLFSDNVRDDFPFMFGPNTEVENSCSLTWKGRMLVFGRDLTKYNLLTFINLCESQFTAVMSRKTEIRLVKFKAVV